jgi:hypothetical protein
MQFVEDGEERVVVGSLDLNQCLWLPDELTGKRPGVRLLLPFSFLLQNIVDNMYVLIVVTNVVELAFIISWLFSCNTEKAQWT